MKNSLQILLAVGAAVGMGYVIYFRHEYIPVLQRVIALAVCVLAAVGGITAFRSGKNTAMAVIFGLISVGALVVLLLDLLYFR